MAGILIFRSAVPELWMLSQELSLYGIDFEGFDTVSTFKFIWAGDYKFVNTFKYPFSYFFHDIMVSNLK